MAKFPAMPFFFGDYYRDTEHLTFQEHGIYLKLLSLLWHAPRQKIPNNFEWLDKRFPGHVPEVLSIVKEFGKKNKNWIWQPRLKREFKYVASKCKKQSVRAKSRWHKEKDVCHGNATAMHPHPHPIGLVSKKEATNGNVIGIGKHRVKPKHGQMTKDRLRIWLDTNTTEFTAYSVDYWNKHHHQPKLQWDESGAWFNQLGE